MRFQDKSIQCSDCEATFTSSADEQEFFAPKDCANETRRCPSCHAARKMERYGDGDYSYMSRSWR